MVANNVVASNVNFHGESPTVGEEQVRANGMAQVIPLYGSHRTVTECVINGRTDSNGNNKCMNAEEQVNGRMSKVGNGGRKCNVVGMQTAGR